MILGCRFLKSRWQDKSSVGDDKGKITEGVEITGYDPVKKACTAFGFGSDGSTSEASLTVDGNTWIQLTLRAGPDGETYQGRMVTTFSAASLSTRAASWFGTS